ELFEKIYRRSFIDPDQSFCCRCLNNPPRLSRNCTPGMNEASFRASAMDTSYLNRACSEDNAHEAPAEVQGPPLAPEGSGARAPLSFAHQQVWIHAQLA